MKTFRRIKSIKAKFCDPFQRKVGFSKLIYLPRDAVDARLWDETIKFIILAPPLDCTILCAYLFYVIVGRRVVGSPDGNRFYR